MSENKNTSYTTGSTTGYVGSKGYVNNNSNDAVTIKIDDSEVYKSTTHEDSGSSSSDC